MGSSNSTPSIYLTVPISEYFNKDKAVWNVESEDQLIKLHIQNGKQAPLCFMVHKSAVLVLASHFECRI